MTFPRNASVPREGERLLDARYGRETRRLPRVPHGNATAVTRFWGRNLVTGTQRPVTQLLSQNRTVRRLRGLGFEFSVSLTSDVGDGS